MLEIVLDPEGYWRILSRESTRSKSALKHSYFHQSCKQGTHSSGPSCCKYIYVLINSIMLSMKQTCTNVRKKHQGQNRQQTIKQNQKSGLLEMKARDALKESTAFRFEMREHENLKLSSTPKRKQRAPNSKESLGSNRRQSNPLEEKIPRFVSSKCSLFKFSKNTKSSLRRY